MYTARRFFPGLFLSSVLAVGPLLATAQQFGESVIQRGHVQEDVYLAGGSVRVLGQVDGDVSAAGGRVSIEDTVNGDVAAFGGSVELRAKVKDDARITGGGVWYTARSAMTCSRPAAPWSSHPRPGSAGARGLREARSRSPDAWARGLKAAGGEIVIAGEILGDVDLIGENIEIRPGAIIHGRLNYRSPNEATIDPGARLLGAVVQLPLEARPGAQAGHAGARVFMLLSLSRL